MVIFSIPALDTSAERGFWCLDKGSSGDGVGDFRGDGLAGETLSVSEFCGLFRIYGNRLKASGYFLVDCVFFYVFSLIFQFVWAYFDAF